MDDYKIKPLQMFLKTSAYVKSYDSYINRCIF